MAYIDRDLLLQDISESVVFTVRDSATSPELRGARKIIDRIKSAPTADVVEVVRCKDCTEWDRNECECSHWYGFRENDYCSYGERRTEQKTTCLNCKHLMFSDMYGECNKQLRIVKPSDTCEYAEPKERGAE